MTKIEGDRPRRPAEVDRSLRYWWIAIGGQILFDALQLILPGIGNSVTRLFFQAGRAPSSGVAAFELVMQVVTLFIWVLLVHNVGRGSNGARWTLTIVAAIEDLVLLAGLVAYFVAATVGSILLGVVGLAVFVCVVLAVVAMHQPRARSYFQTLT
jgi:hypothetical protein